METRKFFIGKGPGRESSGTFQLTLNYDKLKGKALYNLLRNSLRREVHFRGMKITGMGLYDSRGKVLIPRQPEPKPEDDFIQNVKFIYLDLFPSTRRSAQGK